MATAARASTGLAAKSRGAREPSARRANLAGLLFCFLSIISVCLTIFNLYLFVWVWSSLGSPAVKTQDSPAATAGASPSAVKPIKLNLFDQLDLLRDEGKLAFQDRLLAKRPVEVRTIGQLNEGATLRLSSRDEVRLCAPSETDQRQHPFLVVSAGRESLNFPQGFKVQSATRQATEPLLECRPPEAPPGRGHRDGKGAEPFCHLRARQLELANPSGVDLGALRSIQTSHVRSRRLHSALNKLQLMASGGPLVSFESRDEQVHLRALESVSLGARNSTVIISATTIKLGGLAEVASERQLARLHKLCVCLREPLEGEHEGQEGGSRGRRAAHREAPERANNGRVFAVPSHLRCAQFSETLCTSGHQRGGAD